MVLKEEPYDSQNWSRKERWKHVMFEKLADKKRSLFQQIKKNEKGLRLG